MLPSCSRHCTLLHRMLVSTDALHHRPVSGAVSQLARLAPRSPDVPDAPGPGARATELAALALANLAAENTSRRAIRLSGGVPPLARLLTLRPCGQARSRAQRCCAPSRIA